MLNQTNVLLQLTPDTAGVQLDAVSVPELDVFTQNPSEVNTTTDPSVKLIISNSAYKTHMLGLTWYIVMFSVYLSYLYFLAFVLV
jgi:hypothetical protein